MHYDTVWPQAPSVAENLSLTSRPADLSGRTVAFIWDYVFRGDEMFPILESELTDRFPGVRFVPYDVFGNIHGPNEREVLAALPDRLRQYRVDAAIVGVGN